MNLISIYVPNTTNELAKLPDNSVLIKMIFSYSSSKNLLFTLVNVYVDLVVFTGIAGTS